MDVPRRRLLAVGGIAALAGCSGKLLSESRTTETDTDTPSGVETDDPSATSQAEFYESILGTLPRSADDRDVMNVNLFTPVSADSGQATMVSSMRTSVTEETGLPPSSVDAVGVAYYGQHSAAIVTMVGSFDADEPDIPDSDEDEVATHREDGLFIGAGGGTENSSAWEAGLDAAEDALEDESKTLASNSGLDRVLDPVSENGYVVAFPTMSTGNGLFSLPDSEEFDEVSTIAIGHSQVSEAEYEATMAILFEDESSVDESVVEDVTESGFFFNVEDPTTEVDGRLVVGTGTYEADQHDSTSGPSVFFNVSYDDDSGEISISHEGGETLSTDRTTVLVDGTEVDGVWEADEIEEGEVARISADPFSVVTIEWIDSEDDESVEITNAVAFDSSVFEGAYDPEADTVTFTYSGNHTASTEKLRLVVQEHDDGVHRNEDAGEPLSKNELETGEEIAVEDIQYGQSVGLRVSYESDHSTSTSTVASVSTEPDGWFSLDHEAEELVYEDSAGQPASNYRVSVDGESAERQWSEQHETLEPGDRLSISGEPGDEIVVEWVGEDGPIELFSERIRPPVSFELARDGDHFELTYTAEMEWEATEFELTGFMSEDLPSFESEYDTLSSGDSIDISAESVHSFLEVRWTGAEEPIQIFEKYIPSMLRFELEQSSGGYELVFTGDGTWPAEEFAINIEGESASASFADEYETITSGDSVSVSAALGDRLTVEWNTGQMTTQAFSDNVHPKFAFDYEYDEDAEELTLTSKTEQDLDAGKLQVTLHSEDGTEGLDVWAESYETVTKGDSVTIQLSSFTAVEISYTPWEATTFMSPYIEPEIQPGDFAVESKSGR